jgi:hypothetical protein
MQYLMPDFSAFSHNQEAKNIKKTKKKVFVLGRYRKMIPIGRFKSAINFFKSAGLKIPLSLTDLNRQENKIKIMRVEMNR